MGLFSQKMGAEWRWTFSRLKKGARWGWAFSGSKEEETFRYYTFRQKEGAGDHDQSWTLDVWISHLVL